MANIQYTPTAGLVITGITPATGPKPTVQATQNYAGGATAAGDYVSDTFVVNANTPATAINLGKITTGRAVVLQCDGQLRVSFTQDLGAGPVDVTLLVDKFIMLQSGFTGLKLANASLTVAVNVSVSVAGDRDAVGAGPGIF